MISTHILDTSSGNPAKDVEVILKKKNKLNQWEIIDQGKTNSDGRYVFNGFEGIGIYQINFAIENYFKLKNIPFFFLDKFLCAFFNFFCIC